MSDGRSATVVRSVATVRSVVDQAVVAKVREGRLRDDSWPYGLRAVVLVGVVLVVLTALLALFAGPIRGWSELTVPNSLSSSVPADLVWVLVFLLAFCLALFTTAAIHGPWWMTCLGLLALVLLLGVWSVATTTAHGLTVAVPAAGTTILVVVVLLIVRRRRGLGWWEFPLVFGLIGFVLALCLLDFARSERLLGFRLAPIFVDQTISLLAFLVLPAAFAAGAAVAEIAVGLTVVAARAAQRQSAGRWPYVVLAAVVVLRLAQEVRRLIGLDPVNSGWIALLPAVGLVAAFAGLGWLISRLAPLGDVPVAALPDDLSRIAVPVGAAVIAMLLPVYVFVFGFQIVVSVNPSSASGGFDPSPLVDRLVDGFRVVLGVLLVGLALWQARRGRGGGALVLGGAGLLLVGLGVRLLTGYRWALWLDPDAMVSVVTLGILLVTAGPARPPHVVPGSSARHRCRADPGRAAVGALGDRRPVRRPAGLRRGRVRPLRCDLGLPDRLELGQHGRTAGPAAGPGAAGPGLPAADDHDRGGRRPDPAAAHLLRRQRLRRARRAGARHVAAGGSRDRGALGGPG